MDGMQERSNKVGRVVRGMVLMAFVWLMVYFAGGDFPLAVAQQYGVPQSGSYPAQVDPWEIIIYEHHNFMGNWIRYKMEPATISAGGGKFLGPDESYDPRGNLQGPYTATGLTDMDGVYTTSWVCNPCARAYGLRVEGAKDRYMTGTADLTIETQTTNTK